MATLTYDPTPADQPEFTPEEQESIALGEQLEQQQQNLLAGKYKDARELEKAYVELQRKLGQPSEQPEEEEELEVVDQEEQVQDADEDTEDETEETVSMSDEDIKYLKDLVGGEEDYGQMIAWAAENLSPEEIQAYDYVMDMNNPWAAFFAVKALSNSYNENVGYDGQMLTGKAASNPADVFRSQAEVVAAMSDPRYDSDPAYRDDVFLKLDRSNLTF